MKKRRGRIQAWLDSDIADIEGQGDTAPGLEVDEGALEAARRRSRFVRGMLASAEVPQVEIDRALAEVHTRLDRRRAGERGREPSPVGGNRGARQPPRRRVAWAASIVLVLGSAAAAAAVPGSPVRAWLDALVGGSRVQVETGTDEPSPAPVAAASVLPTTDRFVVSVVALPSDGEIRVRIVTGERLSVEAPAGSRFSSGDERIELRPAPGVVRVDLPRGLPHAVLQVNGRVVLEREGSRVRTPEPGVERAGDTWIIRRGGS